MSGHTIRPARSYVCAYCGEPLELTSQGVRAWRVGEEFVCNEFCADGIMPSVEAPKSMPPIEPRT